MHPNSSSSGLNMTPTAADRLNYIKNSLEDKQHIHIDETGGQDNGSYTSLGAKPANLFTMAFFAFFRNDTRKQLNRTTIDKVTEDIKEVHGDQAAEAFKQAMSSKRASGSPLTRRAVMSFLDTHNAAVTDGIANKVADAIDVLAKDTTFKAGDVHGVNFSVNEMKLERLYTHTSSPLNQSLKDICPPKEIRDIKNSLISLSNKDKDKDLETLFDKKTSKAARIKILKTVLTPPAQSGNGYNSDEE